MLTDRDRGNQQENDSDAHFFAFCEFRARPAGKINIDTSYRVCSATKREKPISQEQRRSDAITLVAHTQRARCSSARSKGTQSQIRQASKNNNNERKNKTHMNTPWGQSFQVIDEFGFPKVVVTYSAKCDAVVAALNINRATGHRTSVVCDGTVIHIFDGRIFGGAQ